MDHGTCNIDVGCSINIQRTDGECENTARILLVPASAPIPLLPRISVFPLAFPRPLLVPFLSLHSRFFLVAYLSVSYSPRNLQILRLSRSFASLSKDCSSASLVSSSPVAFLSFSLIFFSRCLFSLSLSFILYSLLYLFLTFLFIPDPPIVLYCRSFTVSLSRLPGLARASPRFSAAACHAAGRVAQRPDRRVT